MRKDEAGMLGSVAMSIRVTFSERKVRTDILNDMQGSDELTDVTPVWCYVIHVVRPDNTVNSTDEALRSYPEADGASTYVPGLEHTSRHRA